MTNHSPVPNVVLIGCLPLIPSLLPPSCVLQESSPCSRYTFFKAARPIYIKKVSLCSNASVMLEITLYQCVDKILYNEDVIIMYAHLITVCANVYEFKGDH